MWGWWYGGRAVLRYGLGRRAVAATVECGRRIRAQYNEHSTERGYAGTAESRLTAYRAGQNPSTESGYAATRGSG
eukprot:1505815-Rhodomonas_salina.2